VYTVTQTANVSGNQPAVKPTRRNQQWGIVSARTKCISNKRLNQRWGKRAAQPPTNNNPSNVNAASELWQYNATARGGGAKVSNNLTR